MYLHTIKEKAQELRKNGYSYAYISNKLGVAKSTLSLWLSGINFVPSELFKSNTENAQKQISDFKRIDKALSLKEANLYARKSISRLSQRDIFMLGLGVYIGEGSKTHGILRIVNSDPRIIRFSMMWLKVHFGLKDDNFRIRLHLYPDSDVTAAIYYWTKQLNVSKSLFQNSSIDKRVNKKKDRRGVLPYGTAHLGIVSNGNKDFGVLLHRKILATIDRVLEMRD